MTGAAGGWRLPLHRHHGAAGPGVRLLAPGWPAAPPPVGCEGGHRGQHSLHAGWADCIITALLYQSPCSGGADSSHEYYAEILRFQPDTEEWVLAGSMLQQRYDHASATIHFEDVRDVCFQ